MRVSNVINVKFNGIKILKPVSQKAQDSSSPQKVAFDEMIQQYQNLKDINDTIEITTVDEIKKQIDDDAKSAKTRAHTDLLKRHSILAKLPFYTKVKYRKIDKQIDEKARLDKENAQKTGDINVDLKENVLSSMQNVMRDGMTKIDKLDKEMIEQAYQDTMREKLDGGLLNATDYTNFANVAGYNYEKAVLNDVFANKVIEEKAGGNPEIYGSILFFGPWGNGKSYISKNIAIGSGCKFVPIKVRPQESDSKFMARLYSEAEKSEKNFKETRQRTVLFIDEADKHLGQKSTVSKEFEDFIKTCSEKYHCSVFVATNFPSKLSLDMENPEIFPIRMSIDIPDRDNLKTVISHYFKGITDKPLDYNALVQEFLDIEEKTGAKFNNGQIENIYYSIIDALGDKNATQDDIVAYIKKASIVPVLNETDILNFNQEYAKFIGDDNLWK